MLTKGTLWDVKLLRPRVTVIDLIQFHEHLGKRLMLSQNNNSLFELQLLKRSTHK